MRIAVGADHRGASIATTLIERLRSNGHDVTAAGPISAETSDYTDPAWRVGVLVRDGKADRGILIDGTGLGIAIAANKVRGVRAAVVHDELTAEMSRTHNDANVLCIPADLLGQRLIEKIVDVWLATEFQGGRHERRLKKLQAIEEGRDPGV